MLMNDNDTKPATIIIDNSGEVLRTAAPETCQLKKWSRFGCPSLTSIKARFADWIYLTKLDAEVDRARRV